ncbi:mechanosensitive ion channel family protein [Uliginosibacterium sp. TH139]|uniref:mechanosensitive ion channel family protein n=1 Tax=Uliginosibacterium sp. TH139 TaxID=2067453 RepID=UPI000C7B16E6|nr:mechanosensitive ion channel family protein [Uliginosibacterium sp. TH139]PLK50981.1 mechanosensitive ion channel protein MscS [Uliginosibacterium sp. TH139]
MDETLLTQLPAIILQNLVPFAWKIVGAVVLWVIGGWIIKSVKLLSRRGMDARGFDATLIEYLESAIGMSMRVLLVIAILSLFGVETASFAAIIAAAGVAIGMAWSGLLANFAAGVFLILLRPLRVGDFIAAAGITGTVHEIGMFATTIDQPDNVRTVVGNNKLFADNIVNFSSNDFRRVDLTAQLAHGVDPLNAISLLKARVAQIPNVMDKPAPDVEILEFNPAGVKLVVRPYCHTDDYWQVYFDTNKAILEVATQAGWPAAVPHQVLIQK